ncbi:hypothetical protein [Kitasatospora sp. NPDC018619]|uniref:hypothetical protein n=1 Tax=unclassified Kitasatospora TaxID=2633591 RepID=UPI0037B6632A
MSVLAAFHSVVPDVRRHGHGLRTACVRVLDRLAASPLDSTVLGAVGAPRPSARADALRARRHPVARPDGSAGSDATRRPGR